jgi:DNA-binding NarL/FixJ family response regulator
MRVIIADDEPKVRSALRLLLEQEPELAVVGEAGARGTVLALAGKALPDLVLVDWELPGGSAESLLAGLRRLNPRMLVLVMSGRPEVRKAALAAGANCFVCKGDPPETVLKAILKIRGKASH